MNCSYKKFLVLKKKTNQTFPTRILTGSMSPFIIAGSEVSLKVCDFIEAKPWDIVVYWRKEMLICHILLKKSESSFTTSPLANIGSQKVLDPPIHKSSFLGVVTEPSFGSLHRLFLTFRYRKLI